MLSFGLNLLTGAETVLPVDVAASSKEVRVWERAKLTCFCLCQIKVKNIYFNDFIL